MHFNPYVWTNRRNFRGVMEVDGDVIYQTGSSNMDVLRMRNEKVHYNPCYITISVM